MPQFPGGFFRLAQHGLQIGSVGHNRALKRHDILS